MNCPKCKNKSHVLETRDKDLFITRRYECTSCKQRFTTHEMLYMVGARTKGSSSQHMKNMRKNAKRHDSAMALTNLNKAAENNGEPL